MYCSKLVFVFKTHTLSFTILFASRYLPLTLVISVGADSSELINYFMVIGIVRFSPLIEISDQQKGII